MTEIDRLEALARDATPGPWRQDSGWCGINRLVSADHGARLVVSAAAREDIEPSRRDVAYVAAASPDVLLSLIAYTRRLERAARVALDVDAEAAQECGMADAHGRCVCDGCRALFVALGGDQ